MNPSRKRNSSSNDNTFKNVYDYMLVNDETVNRSKNIANANSPSTNTINFNKSEQHRRYEMRKRKDLLVIRRKKMKELYDMEGDNFDIQMRTKNKKTVNVVNVENVEEERKKVNKKEINKFFEENTQNIPNSPNSQNNSNMQQNNNNVIYNRPKRIKGSARLLIQNDNFSIINNNEENFTYNSIDKIENNPLQDLSNFNQYYKRNIDEELDKTLKRYNENLEQLKLEDFMSRKKMQDQLLLKINSQMEKLKFGLNDKTYEEKMAQEWVKEYQEKIQSFSNTHNPPDPKRNNFPNTPNPFY